MRLSRFHPAIGAFPLLVVMFFACACQASLPPSPTATSAPSGTSRTLPTDPALATTPPAAIPPSRTPEPSATPSPTSTATTTPAALNAGGPWLLYQRDLLSPEGGFSEAIFVSNQDGSGIQIINGLDCEVSAAVSILDDPANRLAKLGEKFVLINQDRAVTQLISPDCQSKYFGDVAGGLLATIDRAAATAELRVYELPSGKLRGAFPIPPCSGVEPSCNFDTESGRWVAEWGPGGRSLIFPVTLDGDRSDLYLYDAQNGATRQLTSIQGRVSRVWWSPAGTNILLGLSPGGDHFLESFWAVPAASGESRRLITTEAYLADVDLLGWLDENRFLFYSGSLQNIVSAGAYNLRMLDILSNKETTLLNDGFLWAGLDRQTGTVGVVVAVYNSHSEDGVYLIPVTKPTPQKIAPVETAGIYRTFWDEDLRLFITGDPCQDGGQEFRAFDSKGNWDCVPAPMPDSMTTETPPAAGYASPDGQWRLLLNEGLWLENGGKPAVKVDDMTPTQVIWRLDSGGFFFVASRGLYYVSLPDLAVQLLDRPDQIGNGMRWGSDQLEYQWIGYDDGG